jgi:hypothetical protein
LQNSGDRSAYRQALPDGRAELKVTRLAAGAAKEREDGRRKEFAAELVPREGGFFEDPHASALTHGGKCSHHAGRASAHNMDSSHQRSSCMSLYGEDAAFL